MTAVNKTTPMMLQYRQLRKGVPDDTILFFRLGDFYEMFFDDAKEAAGILDITLTKRQGLPMCGVPYHAAEGYLARLIRAGKRVAICDQVEDPSASKGIVKREVTRIVTPGTVLEDQVLDADRHNYLAGLYHDGHRYGLALLDLSTGAFEVEEHEDPASLRDLLIQYAPSECVLPEEARDHDAYRQVTGAQPAFLVSGHDDWTFDNDTAIDLLTRHFKVHSLEGYGCADSGAGVCAAGAVLHYVSRELRRTVDHVRSLRVRLGQQHLLLDETTVRNLDLLPPANSSQGSKTCLLKVLNATRTAMGARLLREWMLRPLTNTQQLASRHDAVSAFTGDRLLLQDTRETLGHVRDLERLTARLNTGGNARDVRAVAESLKVLPALKELLAPSTELAPIAQQIDPCPDLVKRIEEALTEEPPALLRDGGIIRPGFSAELDDLRKAATEGRQWLADFQQQEQERTGIKSLKVRYNKVFGYYIEISKHKLEHVPDTYVRKQTLVNAERFITPDLKEYENRILGAQDRALELELELFAQLRMDVVAETGTLQQTAAATAELDVLASLADRALSLNYVRPMMNDSTSLDIRDGRHPVVEQLPDAEPFVPNDTLLDTMEHQLVLITGPNMAGKSTYIRQVAVLVVMAQMGSFVPATYAEMGMVDRVFTRVGASDDLARGRSTFMVEMQETANILNNATPHSLIVLDEIGRGTSTFDGISIAWAVAEYLHNNGTVKARTLFATHYHELTELERSLPGAKNYNVLVRERNGQITFLRRIAKGAADQSYGIQVARLAGLPQSVIERAHEILQNLEEGELEGGQAKLAKQRPRKKQEQHPNQLNLFE